MLRPSVVLDLKQCLNKPPEVFEDDFQVLHESIPHGTRFRIQYSLGNSEYFDAKILPPTDKRTTYVFECAFFPGEVSEVERQSFSDVYFFKDSINKWVSRIIEEIHRSPGIRIAQDHAERLEEIERRLKDIPERPASIDELERLREWMTDLNKTLSSKIETLELTQAEKDKRINDLQASIDNIKERASSLNLRQSLRAVLARVCSIDKAANTATLIDLGMKAVGALTAS